MVTRSLSYIGFVSPTADEWRAFGPEVLGAELAPDGPDGAVRLRVDGAAPRIIVHPGEADDLAYLGWDVGDAASLAAVAQRAEEAGLDVQRGDAELAQRRGVGEVAAFTDHFGFRHELSYGLHDGGVFTPGRPMAGFVTGEQGLGHVVLIVPDRPAAERFLTEVLGLRVSDSVESGMSVRFFHCPGHAARHHTVAVAGVPGRAGFHHLMLEVTNLDDVGTALDIVNARKIPLAMSLGRHTNDLRPRSTCARRQASRSSTGPGAGSSTTTAGRPGSTTPAVCGATGRQPTAPSVPRSCGASNGPARRRDAPA
jgi:extradiol dioxygenase